MDGQLKRSPLSLALDTKVKTVNAAFELAVCLAAAAFFVFNAGDLFYPGTHPQWRFAIAVSVLVCVVAGACFAGSMRRIREEGAKADGQPPKKG